MYNELKALIIKKGFKIKEIASSLKISRYTLLRKLKTGEFKLSEIKEIRNILGYEEVDKIFFV